MPQRRPAPRPGADQRDRPSVRPAGRGAGQQSLRRQNLAVVLRHVVTASAPLSRADLAAATGLTRATVSTLVEWLVDARLVRELEPVAPERAGRPAVPLAPASGTVAAVGAEINVDYLGVRVLDLGRSVLAEHVEAGDFRDSDPATVLARLSTLVRSALDAVESDAGPRLAGGGLALPGLVDASTGFVRVAPNLGWREVDVRHALATADPAAPVALTIGNEADLAGRAEARARAASGMTSFLYVSGEVGVGAAIVLDGELLRGRHGWSGELGHVALGTTGSLGDGSTLEGLAGKDAITRAAGLRRSTTVAEIRRRAEAGDPRVREALARAGDALGVALSGAANLVDVETVVLGGIYADLADHLMEPVLSQLRHRLISAPWVEPSVHVAVAGPYPAMTGAALGALDEVVADPLGWADPAGPRGRPTPPAVGAGRRRRATSPDR